MKILLAYIYVSGGPSSDLLADRFLATYSQYRPRIEHDTVIVCNGGNIDPVLGTRCCNLFRDQGGFFPRANDPGWDLSAYIDVANRIECDMLVCFGESVYFHRGGWLERLVEAWNIYGPGLYGIWASNHVRPHINTTGFVCDPNLLKGQAWPKCKEDRYEFEHGKNSFWHRVQGLGKPVKLVTWDGIWDPPMWRLPHNCFWRGTQENCLAFCSHTDRFRSAHHLKQAEWSYNADATPK